LLLTVFGGQDNLAQRLAVDLTLIFESDVIECSHIGLLLRLIEVNETWNAASSPPANIMARSAPILKASSTRFMLCRGRFTDLETKALTVHRPDLIEDGDRTLAQPALDRLDDNFAGERRAGKFSPPESDRGESHVGAWV
jgi:hypothetical protein